MFNLIQIQIKLSTVPIKMTIHIFKIYLCFKIHSPDLKKGSADLGDCSKTHASQQILFYNNNSDLKKHRILIVQFCNR